MTDSMEKIQKAEQTLDYIADAPDNESVVKAVFLGGVSFAASDTDPKLWGEEKSRALSADDWETKARGETIPPLAQPRVWALTAEQNTRLNRCIRTFARNTVGLGWEVVFRYPDKVENDKEERRLAEAEMDKALELLDNPNDEMPLAMVLEMMKIDEESVGNGWLELVRNRADEIVGIYHVPGTTVRWRRDLEGYIQIRNGKKRYFKRFGDDRVIDARTGREFEGAPDYDYTATELIQFKIYSPRSSFYGIPRYIATAPAIAGNRFAALRNVAFFENDAVPRMLITINGGVLDEDSMKDLRKFFERGHKGVANAHRVAILQPKPRQQMLGQQSSPIIRPVPLTVASADDASHTKYTAMNNEEIREAFGISEAFFQSYNINRASASVGRETTNEQEFEPDRVLKEYIINHKIIWGKNGLGLKKIKFKLKRLQTINETEGAQVDSMLAANGALTPNEIRQRHGLPSFPEDYVFADKPFALAMNELKLGIAMAFAGQKPPATPQEAQKRVQKVFESIGYGQDALKQLLSVAELLDKEQEKADGS